MLHTMAHSETRLASFVHCKTDFGTDPINSDKSRAGAKIAEAELFDRVPSPHVGGYGSSSAVAIQPWRER
jgi:hypothetical protein